jgi:hypothetical protein
MDLIKKPRPPEPGTANLNNVIHLKLYKDSLHK